MSSSPPELGCEREADCAAYVLWALPDQEAEAHVAHLAECSICRTEVSRLQPVAALLAVGVPLARSDKSLDARVLGAVRAEAELRDKLRGTRSASPAVGGSRSAPRRWRWARVRAPRLARGRFTAQRLLPALAATLAIGVGIAIGALAFGSTSGEGSELIRAIVVVPGRHATAELRKVGEHLELVVVGMPAPPPGRIYEVWLEHGAQAPEPTDALFSVTNAGSGSVGVPGNLQGVSKVLVTDEPLGGSLKPTRKPVIVGSV